MIFDDRNNDHDDEGGGDDDDDGPLAPPEVLPPGTRRSSSVPYATARAHPVPLVPRQSMDPDRFLRPNDPLRASLGVGNASPPIHGTLFVDSPSPQANAFARFSGATSSSSPIQPPSLHKPLRSAHTSRLPTSPSSYRPQATPTRNSVTEPLDTVPRPPVTARRHRGARA